MSTFGGKIEEIPGITVDRFVNTGSQAYFLSHCHQDHTIGLYPELNEDFYDYICNNDHVFLYTTPICVKILTRAHAQIETKLKALPLRGSTMVPINDKYMSVTVIPAGHCPGSVMFLFETADKTVLYTGDYRINPADLSKFKSFKNTSGQLKRIDALYLDTTFFLNDFETFPNRNAITKQLAPVLTQWVRKSKRHVIKINTPATYGSENFFIEVSKLLQMPVHVSPEKYDFYTCIPEMDNCVTLDGSSTSLHSGCGLDYRTICREIQSNFYVKSLKPSALIWTKGYFERNNSRWIKQDCAEIRICYSCHASLEEGRALLQFLKPAKVEPCVVPKESGKQRELKELLDECLKIEEASVADVECNGFISVEKIKQKREDKTEIAAHEDESMSFLLESPPRGRKKGKFDAANF